MLKITNHQKIALHYSLLYLEEDKTGEIFYRLLLEEMPHLKHLFTDFEFQQQRFMSFLIKAVYIIDEPAKLKLLSEEVAVRHSKYNLELSRFQVMKHILLRSLAIALGDKYTPEIGQAWNIFYDIVANSMVGHVHSEITS